MAPGHPIGERQHLGDEPAERRRVDRPAVDLDPLPIRDQVGLGGLAHPEPRGPQRASGEGEHAALPVRATDQSPTDAELRVAHGPEQGPRPAQAEADAESASVGQRSKRVVVPEDGGVVCHCGLRAHAGTVTPG